MLLLPLLLLLVLSGRQLIKSSAGAGDADAVGAGAAGIIVAIKSFTCERHEQVRQGVRGRGKEREEGGARERWLNCHLTAINTNFVEFFYQLYAPKSARRVCRNVYKSVCESVCV